MSQSSFCDASPWPHVWPYYRRPPVVLSSLEQAPHAGLKSSWEQTDALHTTHPSWPSLLANTRLPIHTSNGSMNRHDCQSILPSNTLAAMPTFSQIFIMAHTSSSHSDEDISRYPIITTHHHVPNVEHGGRYGLRCEPITGPPMLLPTEYPVEIPVIRDGSIESPSCSPIVESKLDDLDVLKSSQPDYEDFKNSIVQIDRTPPCTPSIGAGQAEPGGWTVSPARNISSASPCTLKNGSPDPRVVKAQKSCILKLARASTTFGAPSNSIESRLRHVATVFGISLVIVSMPSAIMCIFEGSGDTKRPEVHYVHCDRRLSLRNLRRIDIISEQLVNGAMHSLGTAMRLHVGNAINQLDNVLVERPKSKSTGLTRVFERFVLRTYSLCVLSKGKQEPFGKTNQ